MAGPIRIAILADGSRARREIGQVGSSLGRLQGLAGKGLAIAGMASLTAGVVGFAKSAVDLEAKFSTTMRLIQASTGATAREMTKLDRAAMQLGADTSFSAGEAADAMLELAKAGLDTKTILGGGVAGTLQLAAAGGTELGTAATIASNALNAFNLQGKDMAAVAAALAGGANASTASVESLGQGLQQVGPGAVNAGLSLNETVAALSAFDAAGIKGSDAGTSLKTMLARLVPTTKTASKEMEKLGLDFVKGNGEFESLGNVAGQLQKRLGKLSEAERSVALTRIFGSDASRAAAVLMKEGEKGVRKFVKATKDQDAAQEMANARMSGTEGALERLGGAYETAQLQLGKAMAPAVQRLADLVAGNLEPAMDAVITGAREFGSAVQPLVPMVKAVGGVIVELASFIGKIPSPMREIGIQAGLAALVLPRLAGAVTSVGASITLASARIRQFNAEMTYSATRGAALAGVMSRVGAAAKSAAGIGGMVALAQGSERAGTALGTLATVGGGALMGFSLGGPWGAAVGAGAGALYGLQAAADASRESFRKSREMQLEYKNSLDQTTASVTKQTRQIAFQNLASTELLTVSRSVGISDRDMVSAAVGDEDAIARITGKVRELTGTMKDFKGPNADQFFFSKSRAREFIAGIEGMGTALSKEQRELIKSIEASKTLGEALKGLPKDVRPRVRALGAAPALKEVRALGREFDLTPKQVRTIVKAVGIDKVRNDAKGARKGLEDVGRARVDMSGFKGSVTAGVGAAKEAGARGGRDVAKSLKTETGKAKADLKGFKGSVTAGAGEAKGLASAGGQGVGAALKAGIIVGFAGAQSALAAQAAAAVRGAIAAARNAGKVRSPSRETRYIGEMLGKGLEVGMADKTKDAEKGGEKLGKAAVAGIQAAQKLLDRRLSRAPGGLDSVQAALDEARARAEAQIEKRIKRKKPKDEERAERRATQAATAALKAKFDALKAIGRQQDANVASLEAGKTALEEQRGVLDGLIQGAKDYANGIADGFREFGNLLQLGQREDVPAASNPWAPGAGGAQPGGRNIGTILEDLRKRAAEAEEFRNLMTSLQASGLNETTVQQMLAAGPEAALATAQAIAAGGGAAVQEINSLTASIGSQGQALGNLMADKFHTAGIDAARGLVQGLEAEVAQIEAAGTRIAEALTRAVRKQLRSKSPSRVFQDIGGDVVAGLGIGLDETYVHRQGQAMATKLVGGFGTPALDAYMSATMTGSPLTADMANLAAKVAELAERLASTQPTEHHYRELGAAAGAASARGVMAGGNTIARRRRRDI